MKSRMLRCTAVVLTCLVMVLPAQAQDAAEILRRVDAFRNPLDSFTVDVELTSYRGEKTETSRVRVYTQNNDKSLVEFRSPASEKGKYLLMVRDAMWIYLPGTSRPIRISPMQRLMGDASNGDVARTNYSTDYVPQLVKDETSGEQDAFVLDLKARDPELSYTRIKLWVDKKAYRPLRAEFYVSSGKLMKRAVFKGFDTLGGQVAVTTIEIQDAVRPGHRTLMQYSNLQSQKHAEKMFNKDYLGKW
jgi:outer membrane lipoprotein-sorting protein